jgi:exodeoxyribonuclease VII large subunit
MMNDSTESVSQVVLKIKHLLEDEFRHVSVVGEVSNFSSSATGHFYFTLSDKEASLSCALFRADALRNPLIKKLKNGDKVECFGPLGVYAKRGSFQLLCRRISPVGKGDLQEKLKLLKRKLAAEGLFDFSEKREVPLLAKRVAVITAEKGAAFQDFINVFKRRSLWMDIILVPALVQGENAPASIRSALTKVIQYHLSASKEKKIDVVVLTRGGGSLEDLWAFNDEGLAWDIYNCPIPIISAVGHEVDTSISDMVADQRLETPTAAAEVLSEAQLKLKERMQNQKRSLQRLQSNILANSLHQLERSNPSRLYQFLYRGLLERKEKLEQFNVWDRIYEFTGYHNYTMRLEDCLRVLKNQKESLLSKRDERLKNANNMIRVLNPDNVLGRGYTYLLNEEGELVGDNKSFTLLPKDSVLNIKFKDGSNTVKKIGDS